MIEPLPRFPTPVLSIKFGNKEKTETFCEAIKFLINKYILTNIIEKGDIILSVKKNIEIEESNVKSFKQVIKTPRKSVIARSEKQSDYIKALKENDIVMSLGPAGTGKSFLAVSVGVTLLMEKKIDRVILSRPAVEAGEKLGFLPGDMKEKVDPYLRPLYDALYELFGVDKIDKKTSYINAEKLENDNLLNVSISQFDENFILENLIISERAVIKDKNWLLKNVVIIMVVLFYSLKNIQD